jgi:cyclase
VCKKIKHPGLSIGMLFFIIIASGGLMEIIRIDSLFAAFIRPEQGANVGLVHTAKGMILIDTTSYPSEMEALFEAEGINKQEVQMLINTHFHSDHTWGNQLFSCPILAQRLCRQRMQSSLKNEWRSEVIQAYITDLEKTDPKKAEAVRQNVKGLQIKLPDQVFDDHYHGELGGVKYEVIHMGGHTPDSSIVWIPEKKVLYASDLIFQGRYPYIFDADIPAWIGALSRLLEFEAEVIIPGHGERCGEAEINTLQNYLEVSWQLVMEHVIGGHSIDEAASDRAFPVFPGEKYERLHKDNIRAMYKKFGRVRND